MSSSSSLFHYTPRYVIDALKEAYPNDLLLAKDIKSTRSLVRKMLQVNVQFSKETIEHTLHYLINKQSTSADDADRLNEFVKSNIDTMITEYHEQDLCLC